jgi:MFS family permease
MTGDARRFALQYALANVGAFICFVPLIGLLLPRRMAELDPVASLVSLSWALLCGAVAASLANIGGGAISDRLALRGGSRIRMIALGLALTCLTFPLIAAASTVAQLIAGFVLFQICFNLMFAPLSALVTDYVADADKGRMFGLLNLALPISQGSVFLIASIGLTTLTEGLAVISLVAIVCILPLFLGNWGKALQRLRATHCAVTPSDSQPEHRPPVSRDFLLAWTARLLVQCASVAVGSYLFLHLTALEPGKHASGSADQWFGQLSLMSALIGIGAGWGIGMASDRIHRRRPFLWASALFVAVGCASLATATDRVQVDVGFALFTAGLAAFLTIDGALVAQLVGRVPNRAFLLGILNLTNTIPGIVVPALTIAVGQLAQSASVFLFIAVAACAACAAGLAAMIRSVD